MDENVFLMAEALAQSNVEAGIRRAVSQLPKQPPGFNGRCVDCGEDIPAARLSFGAVTCVYCQTLRERKASLIRKR